MRKIIGIVLGWWFWATNQNNGIARKRLLICAGCDLRRGFLCGVCLCPLAQKARLIGEFDEGCPISRWPAIK